MSELEREVAIHAHLERGVYGKGEPTDIYPDWVYEAREAIRRQSENPPQFLKELCVILGWQGGTIHQALNAVRRLVAVDKESQKHRRRCDTMRVAGERLIQILDDECDYRPDDEAVNEYAEACEIFHRTAEDDPIVMCRVCRVILYDEAAKTGYCTAHEPATEKVMQPYIDIVFDGPPGPEAGRFVEVEDADGKSKSIRFGEWIQRPDGYWVLRFLDTRPTAAIRALNS